MNDGTQEIQKNIKRTFYQMGVQEIIKSNKNFSKNILFEWKYTARKTKLKIRHFSSPLLKSHTVFIFLGCAINISFKTSYRPQHQSRSKDFNHMGEKSFILLVRLLVLASGDFVTIFLIS